MLVELTPDGANYIAARDNEANATPTDVVRQLLTTEPGLTFRELLTRWPAEATRPTVTTLHRCLTRMTDDGELARTGAGHRHEPYRYWLVGKADSNNDLGEMKTELCLAGRRNESADRVGRRVRPHESLSESRMRKSARPVR